MKSDVSLRRNYSFFFLFPLSLIKMCFSSYFLNFILHEVILEYISPKVKRVFFSFFKAKLVKVVLFFTFIKRINPSEQPLKTVSTVFSL